MSQLFGSGGGVHVVLSFEQLCSGSDDDGVLAGERDVASARCDSVSKKGIAVETKERMLGSIVWGFSRPILGMQISTSGRPLSQRKSSVGEGPMIPFGSGREETATS